MLLKFNDFSSDIYLESSKNRNFNMKKVTLLLPDKLIHTLGSSISSIQSKIDVTPENLLMALSYDDYHESFKFNKEDIEIISIEDF